MGLAIVTIAKNDAGGLRRTLSNLAASHRADRHIVWVANSNDDSLGEARMWAGFTDSEVIDGRDTGPYDAMNKCMDLLDERDRVWFLNSGDMIAYAAAASDAREWTESSSFQWGIGPVVVRRQRSSSTQRGIRKYRRVLHAAGVQSVCHQSMIARVGSIRALGGFDLTYQFAADFKLMLDFSQHVAPLIWPRPIAVYQAQGLSDRNLKQTIAEQRRIVADEVRLGPAQGMAVNGLHVYRIARIASGRAIDSVVDRGNLGFDWRRFKDRLGI